MQRVFILDKAEAFLPHYLRFIRGLIDTNDLPLNVSRELLQESPVTRKLKKAVTKRALGMLEKLAAENDKYAAFCNNDAILKSDIEWGGSSLTVLAGKNVTINLNAHSIDAKNNGTVIKVYGTLTLENTGDIGLGGGTGSGSDSGRLMNGTSGDKGGAGGILIADGGTLIMNGGWIYNCTSTNSSDGAGGVYVSEGATFEMSAGVIRQCNGHPSEGLLSTASGVVNRGTFTMTKFPILYSGNATSTNTSDTIVYNSGTFNANAYSSSPICSSAESNKSNVVNMGTIQSAPNTYGPKFQVPVINMGFGTISGGV